MPPPPPGAPLPAGRDRRRGAMASSFVRLVIAAVALACLMGNACAFQLPPRLARGMASGSSLASSRWTSSSRGATVELTRRRMASDPQQQQPPLAPPPLQGDGDEEDEEEEYTAIARLREEAESPFRSLRFFIYGGMAASGAVGAFISLTGALAAASGVRGATPLAESGQNLAIDVGALALAAVLWKLDEKSKSNRLNRLTRGAKIAQLKVQLQQPLPATPNLGDRPVLSLADFRRNRGNARRVVIVAGGAAAVQAALDAARPVKDRLVASDFLLVPVVLEPPPQQQQQGAGSRAVLGLEQEKLTGALDEPYVGWPLLLGEWQDYLQVETATARKQGIDPEAQGISIVLKLNGRVGQRAVGLPNWDRLVGDVERRRRRGLDVTNI